MTRAERNKQYYALNREKIREQQREYHRDYYLRRKKFLLANVTPPDELAA